MDLNQQLQRIREAADYLDARLPRPDLAVVLGSGLAALAEMAEAAVIIPYDQIPHFPQPTVPGHNGQLICGKVGDKQVWLFSGRFHYYEGHDPATVILPMRVLHKLGCPLVILTNAAGGLDPEFTPGDLMLITDHINMTGYNPLRGENSQEWGPRFPDMTHAYDPELGALAQSVAVEQGFQLKQGVYCGLSGPCFETPAEIRMLRGWGASATGMSTVPEAIAANHMGMRVLGISCITNLAAGMSGQKLTHEEVFAASKRAEARFAALIAQVIRRL